VLVADCSVFCNRHGQFTRWWLTSWRQNSLASSV